MFFDWIGVFFLLLFVWFVGCKANKLKVFGWSFHLVGCSGFITWGILTGNLSIVVINSLFLIIGIRNLVRSIPKADKKEIVPAQKVPMVIVEQPIQPIETCLGCKKILHGKPSSCINTKLPHGKPK